MGLTEDKNTAENSLRQALNQSGLDWSINKRRLIRSHEPNIDTLIKDAFGWQHQTTTI
jgi:threonyl-tRNA synthetase